MHGFASIEDLRQRVSVSGIHVRLRIKEKSGNGDHVYCSSRGEVPVNRHLTSHVRTGYPVRNGRAFQLEVTGPPCMSVCGRSFTGPRSIVGGRVGPFHIRIQVFLRRPPTLLSPRGCLEFFGHSVGTEENSEIVRSTYLSPSRSSLTYLSHSIFSSLDPFNTTIELGGMISAALTGRPKPTQKWTFNELDSEPVETHYGPFVDPQTH